MGRFADALTAPGLAAVAEIKRRSPSAGDLRPDADPAALAAAYTTAGAAAISVLIDERFAGSWSDLAAARAVTDVPLLAKGFFAREGDLETARSHGADAVLLLLRDLDDDVARGLMEVAADLGLETLVEAHDATGLARAVALDAPVVGSTPGISTRSPSIAGASSTWWRRSHRDGSWWPSRASAPGPTAPPPSWRAQMPSSSGPP